MNKRGKLIWDHLMNFDFKSMKMSKKELEEYPV